MNAAVDAHEHEMVERKGQLRLGGKKGAPLAGDGDTGRQDLGGMLAWPGEEKMLFRKMLAHPKLVPYYIALCGEGYRMDHLPLLIQQKKGADGFDFHGGRLNRRELDTRFSVRVREWKAVLSLVSREHRVDDDEN